MKRNFGTMELTPIKEETLTSKEFLRLSQESPHLITRSRFVPPVIGKKDFGSFRVRYAVPILKRKAA